MSDDRLTILGTSSATPTVDRFPSAQYLTMRGTYVLLDCGEGTQMQMLRYGYSKLDVICISHLHLDHYLGLLGLLTTMSLNGRTAPVHILCPPGLKDIIETQLDWSQSTLLYQVHWREMQPGTQQVFNSEHITIQSTSLIHRIPCWGYILREKKTTHSIIREKAPELLKLGKKAFAFLKEGRDYTAPDGRVYSAGEYTTPSPPAASYAYITDTIYVEELARQLQGVKILYHEATFLHELKKKATETFHTTALQAATLAKDAGVEQLIIGHYSSRYKFLDVLLQEAQSIFPNTHLATEGKVFLL